MPFGNKIINPQGEKWVAAGGAEGAAEIAEFGSGSGSNVGPSWT